MTFVFIFFAIVSLFIACSPTIEYELTVRVQGEGTVIPSEGEFGKDTITTFKIEPEQGWYFSNWAGDNAEDVQEKDGDWKILMNEAKSLVAVFKRLDYDLDITVIGEGYVKEEIVESPALQSYPYETIVKLTAVSESGWKFQEWQGDQEGTDPLVQIVMDKDKKIKAIFKKTNTINGNINIVHNWPFSVNDFHTQENRTVGNNIGIDSMPINETEFVGGLVGQNKGLFNDSLVKNCYAIGFVEASGPNIGGITGENFVQTLSSESLMPIYTDDSINFGGSISDDIEVLIIDCYYDTETTGQQDIGKGEPTSTELMMQRLTFAEWDFESIWTITEGITYPFLQWELDL